MVRCKDASGQENAYPIYVTPSAYQPRPDIGVVQPDNLVLNGQCEMFVDMPANTAIYLTLRYRIK